MNERNDGWPCTRRPTRRTILAWADACGIDVDNESATRLVRRLHDETIPFDGDPEVVERCVVDAVLWTADHVADPVAAGALRSAAKVVSDTFVRAGLIGDAAPPEREAMEGAEPAPDETHAFDDSIPRPMRHDIIYSVPVEIRLADGRHGTVAHPPFDACVRVKPEQGQTVVVPLDDLPTAARAALRSPVRRRVEVHPRCSARDCGHAFRGFLTAGGDVESCDGEYVCDFVSLFHSHCPDHRRAK